ncbi:MAG: hypothetical protein ACI9MR_002679 [Myxococcota bacterium]|jgi:hypothetical protein
MDSTPSETGGAELKLTVSGLKASAQHGEAGVRREDDGHIVEARLPAHCC